MSELEELRAEIAATEADLKEAEESGKEELVLMYGNNLAELHRKENILLAAAGIFLFN